MAQVLMIYGNDGKPTKFDVDRAFIDQGSVPIFSVVGGIKMLIEAGRPAMPDVFQRGREFFYRDGTPVTRPEDIAHIPPPHRAAAEAFIARMQEGGKAKEKPGKLRPKAPVKRKVIQSVVPQRELDQAGE